MKNKTYSLTISNPCEENWNLMKTTANGRHCFNCKKQVIDFTEKSDEEIIKILGNSNSNICGRFKQRQLNRPIDPNRLNRNKVSFAKLFALLAILYKAPVTAQDKPSSIAIQHNPYIKREEASSENNGLIGKQDITIKGCVLDNKTKEPLPFATLYCKRQDYKTATDKNGNFIIDVKKVSLIDTIEIITFYIGYQPKTIFISPGNANQSQEISLELESPILMGDVIIKDPQPIKKKHKN